jgi:hypothetical protein
MRPPLSSSIRSAAGAGAVLLIAGCAATIMAITDAKCSKAVRRCIRDCIFHRFIEPLADNDTHSLQF